MEKVDISNCSYQNPQEIDANKAREESTDLKSDKQNLFENLCAVENLHAGFKAVKKNRGSPGMDGVTIDKFEADLNKELLELSKELQSWQYVPSPVRRAEIPKPCGGIRLLGVPNIRDRVVQATIKILLEPFLEPLFSPSSFGFRPGRNQEQAVLQAQRIVQSGKKIVVDIDLAKFFDRINHDRLIARLGKVIPDRRILRLIGMTLRSGMMKDGVLSGTPEGATQGSPLSPLLSNYELDELDKELERRGLEYCRFADDCNIFTHSEIEGQKVMSEVRTFIETKLKLQVNDEKSRVAKCEEVKFLGMTIDRKARVAISLPSMKRAMLKVKELTPRRTHKPIEKSVEEINKWYVDWSNYYKMTCYPGQLNNIEAHIRRRLRARFVGQAKRKRFLVRKLVSRGVSESMACKAVYSNKATWKLSKSPAVERAYSNKWFKHQLGFKSIAEDESNLHWKSLKTRPAWH